MGVEDVIRSALNDARRYQRTWADYERQKAAGVTPLAAPRRDLTLEPLVEVIEGRRLVQAHAYRADEMLMLMRIAEDYGFRVGAFHHANEAYKIASRSRGTAPVRRCSRIRASARSSRSIRRRTTPPS